MALTKQQRGRRWSRWHFLIRFLGLTGLLAAGIGLVLLSMILKGTSLESLQLDLNDPGRKELGLGLIAGGGLLALVALIAEIKAAIGMITGQRGAFGSNVVLQVILASGLLAGLNAFSFKHYLRFDWTRDHQFTISDEPDNLRSRLGQLREKTTIVVLLRHVAMGQLGDKPDNYDSAAERKVVEKIKDLVNQFQEFGPQFEVQVLDVQEEGYQEKLEQLTRDNKDLGAAIASTPENTIFFTANGKVSRLGFHDIFQLDKQSSQEANDGRGNLVLLDQGKMPFARKVLNIDEKRPRVALGVVHEFLSMEGSEELGMAGVKKTLTARGFDTKDVILKKWGELNPLPQPAALTYEESKLERLEEELAGLDADIKNYEEGLKEVKSLTKMLQTASLDELTKKYEKNLRGHKLTEEDRQLNLESAKQQAALMEFLLSQQRQQREEMRKERAGLSVDTLGEQRRISDLRAKTNRLLADCDLLILPRMTLLHVARGQAIPNWVYQLREPPREGPEFPLNTDESQRSPLVEAIRDFLKAGKPVLACFGPTNEAPGRMDPRTMANDHLEDDFARLGIKFGKQTVLFNVESKSFGERRGNLLITGANVEVPPVAFDWLPGADRPPGQAGSVSQKPNPIRESLGLTARALAKNQTLDLHIRHPRPVYYVPITGAAAPYDPTFMITANACWNDPEPFPTLERTPHYEPPKSDSFSGDALDQMRTGPFPIGVALETSLPTDWYTGKDASPAKVRVAAIGHGGVFIGPSLSPAKEKLLLDLCNWLLGRDDLLTKGDNRWQYPRVALSKNDHALWQWGTRLGMPLLFAYLGLVVLLFRRLR
jgi:hypothetical protein